MHMFNKLKDIGREIKWKFQKISRGYSDVDVWGLHDWFVEMMIPILTQFKSNLTGYPMSCENIREWENILQHMIELLEKMQDDNWRFDEEKIKAKDEFFKLFSEHFFDLWD